MNPDFIFKNLSFSLAIALTGWSSLFGQKKDSATDKPNIVLIMADDLGYETIGRYGGASYATPNIDNLASHGILFNHAYAQPLSTATRLQLMTGKYNFRNWKSFGIMDPGEKTFGHMMSDAGYNTCISGKWQLWSYNTLDFEPEFRGTGMRPEDSGFDEWFLWHARHTEEKGSRYADPVILDNGNRVENTIGKYGPDLFVDYINNFMERNKDEPFFIYYPMVLTHAPFNPTPDSKDWTTGDRLSSNQENYGDMVEYMDKTIGRIVKKIDELGIREKTLIIFYSDNGTPLGIRSLCAGNWINGGKGLPTDAGTHVPLIANWKGTAPTGLVNNDLISSADFYPTLAEIAGISIGKEEIIDGISFAPQLHGKAVDPRELFLCWHDRRPGAPYDALKPLELWARNKRFKLYDDGRLYDIPNDILEEHPIFEGKGTSEVERSRKILRKALEELPENRRLPKWDPYEQFRK